MTETTPPELFDYCCICKKYKLLSETLPALFLGRICHDCDHKIKRKNVRNFNNESVTSRKGTIRNDMIKMVGQDLALAFNTGQPHKEKTKYGTTVTYTPPKEG